MANLRSRKQIELKLKEIKDVSNVLWPEGGEEEFDTAFATGIWETLEWVLGSDLDPVADLRHNYGLDEDQ